MHRLHISSEDGFTVAEVVIAAAIMFFVLTAIVGLMGVSSRMSVQAKQKSIVTNVVASYIDEIRSKPWDEIQTLDSPYQSVVDGVRITLNMVVVPKSDAAGTVYLKIARITANGVLNGQTAVYQTTVAVRSPSYNRALTGDPDAPTIEWTADAPPANSVIYLNQYLLTGGSSATIRFGTRSTSPVNQLDQVEYTVAGVGLTEALNGSIARFPASSSPYLASPTWDSRQEGVVDGVQTVRATVTDTQDRTDWVTRDYIIDNNPALAPGAASLASEVPSTSTYFGVRWDGARDGGTGDSPVGWYWASQYRAAAYREPTSGGGSDPLAWDDTPPAVVVAAGNTPILAIKNPGPIGGSLLVGNPGYAAFSTDRDAPPFSRFVVAVNSGTPRGIGGAYSLSGVPVVSRPELICDASYVSSSTTLISATSIKFVKYDLKLWVSKPAFPHAPSQLTSSNYIIQYASSASGPWTTVTGDTRSVVTSNANADLVISSSTIAGTKIAEARYYRVGVSGVTPTGYQGGTMLPVLWSNAAGVTSTVNGGKAILQFDGSCW